MIFVPFVVITCLLTHRLAALILRLRRAPAEFVSLQCAVTVEQLFLFRFGNSQLWTAHFGGLDQSFVSQDNLDARDGFDDRFAEN